MALSFFFYNYLTLLAESVVLLATWFQNINTKVSIREFSNGRAKVGSGKECTQIQLHASDFARMQPVPSVLACLSLLSFWSRFLIGGVVCNMVVCGCRLPTWTYHPCLFGVWPIDLWCLWTSYTRSCSSGGSWDFLMVGLRLELLYR